MDNRVVSQEAWLQARAELLVLEKAHTQERARIAELRRQLPWVKVAKDYQLVSSEGSVTLEAAFGDMPQLVVYHLMFGEGWDAPCAGCSQWANAMNGTNADFDQAKARLIAVSSAPIDQLNSEAEKQAWHFPWFSSAGSEFSVDYHGGSRDADEADRTIGAETISFDRGENHGVSVFYKNEKGEVFHTYSCFNRGIEAMNGAFGYFDALPLGRPW